MRRHLIGFLWSSLLLLVSADPPFLFPHGYFDSAKLKPFDAIYLNLMAQSNLEYGGITLEDLDQLDASRKLIERPANLPRTREEDDVILDREPIPLDTDAIAPGPKKKPSDDDGPASLSTLGQAALPQPTAALSIEPPAPVARPMPAKENKKEQRVAEFESSRPRSPFSRIRLLQRRYRRAAEMAAEENPFEEIATRAPARDQMQLQRVRYYLRRHRGKKNKRKFLTRNDIYDPERSERAKMTKQQRKKLREELALKVDSEETEDQGTLAPKETIVDRHMRRPQHAPTDELLETDLRTTQQPHLPTLIPMLDHPPRLPNNPFRAFDISKPTVIGLPIPPKIEDAVEQR